MRDVCHKMTQAFTFVRTERLRCELYRRWGMGSSGTVDALKLLLFGFPAASIHH